MGLTKPGRGLGRSCLLSISPKLSTLSGIPPFSTNSFRLASFLALLIGLNLSFLIGALVWFIKITKVVPFESVAVFRKDPFLALYFSLSLLIIFRSLCLLRSAALFTLTIWPFGPSPSVLTAVKATQGALFRLNRWSEYWCLPLNPSKCEASFFSVDPHQANLQPNLLLTGFRLRFNPTPTFLRVTFDRTLSFSKHVSSLMAKFFHVSRSYTVSLLRHGAPLRSPFLFCTNLFFSVFSPTLHPDGFLSKALSMSPNWNASTERPVMPPPAASRPPLSHFHSPRLLYLPYASI